MADDAVGVVDVDEKPDDPRSDASILKLARERFKRLVDDASDERDMMLDDQRFAALDQWPEDQRKKREDPNQPGGPRPCLTSDTYNQYRVQVVNDARQNRPAVKIRPVDSGADVATARVLQGIDRHVEDVSNAEVAYLTALGSAVDIGLGYFRILTEYANDGSYNNQDVVIKSIPKTLSVYMGPHFEPDGSDATYCFINEDLPLDDFKRAYPGVNPKGSGLDAVGDMYWNPATDVVRVTEYLYIEQEKTKMLLLEDGTTITQKDYDAAKDARPIKDSREHDIKSVKWCKFCGADEILEKQDVIGEYIPVVEVVGNVSWINGKRQCWGMVRSAKDMLRMLNYFLSAATERYALSPKAPFIMSEGQMEGHEPEWRGANTENRSALTYKREDLHGNQTPPPQRQQPPMADMAAAQMLEQIEHRVQAALGMHKASLGEQSNEKSGRAILARQKEGDTATFHFPDNLARSVRHGGRIRIAMYPKLLDTARVARILGEDGATSHATLDPKQRESKRDVRQSDGSIKSIYNVGVGKYDVTITTGPSYNTKRMESQEIFTNLAQAAKDPGSAAVLNFLAIKNADLATDDATKMLQALLPPQAAQALAAGDEGPMPPKAQAAIQQLTVALTQLKQQAQELSQENQQLKSGAVEGQAKVAAAHDEATKKIELRKQEAEAEYLLKKEDQDRAALLAREKAQAELDLKAYVADEELKLARKQAADKIEVEKLKITSTPEADAAKQVNDDRDNVQVQRLVQLHDSLAGHIGEISSRVDKLGQRPTKKLIKDKFGNIVGGHIKYPDGTEEVLQ